MSKTKLTSFQLGKNGLTDNFINSIAKTFKNHELVKVSVLKSCSRNREEIKKINLKLCEQLGSLCKKKFISRIVGYTIFIKK